MKKSREDILKIRKLKKEGNELLKTSKSVSEQIDTIGSKIENLDPNSESHQEYLMNNTRFENELQLLEEANEKIDKQIAHYQQDIINQEKGLEKYGDTLLADEDISRFVNYSNRITESLSSFRELKLKQHIELLESTISDAFKALLRKRSLIDRVKIDRDSFSLVVYDASGRSKEGHNLSAAERQLLSVAMLWGLARASGRVLPIVIDTPLGRLDGDHRPNIVEEYFPEASHQVVLLSTDTEIDKPLYKQLKSKLSNEYLLEFSDKTQSSTVNKGYFWS